MRLQMNGSISGTNVHSAYQTLGRNHFQSIDWWMVLLDAIYLVWSLLAFDCSGYTNRSVHVAPFALMTDETQNHPIQNQHWYWYAMDYQIEVDWNWRQWSQKVTQDILPWGQIWLSFWHWRCIRPGSTIWSKSWRRWWSNTRIRDWEWPHVLSWSSRIVCRTIINWFGTPWWSSIWMTNWSILTWLRIKNTWLWVWLWLEVRWWVSSMRIQPS